MSQALFRPPVQLLLLVALTFSGVPPVWSSNFGTSLPDTELRFLNSAESMTLYAITPEREPKAKDKFCDYPVVAKVNLKSSEGRKILSTALKQGIESGKGCALCFNPHHAIRAKKGSLIHDFVVCFECSTVVEFKSEDKSREFTFQMAPEFQSAFDAILSAGDSRYAEHLKRPVKQE